MLEGCLNSSAVWLLQVHDALVEQGVDPASDAYYAAIEQQVAAAFPDKWAQHLAILAALGEASLRPECCVAGRCLAAVARRSIAAPLCGVPFCNLCRLRCCGLRELDVCACLLAGAKSSGARGSRQQQQQQQQGSQYTSYKISLKPSVAAIRGTGSVGAANTSSSSLQLRQQQYQPGSVPAQRSSATLSQLLQHPQLAQQQQQPQQPQVWQAAGAGNAQLPGRAFAEQMLQLYNQQGAGAAAVSTQQQPASPQGAQQQQQQQQHDLGSPQLPAGLPALQMCPSPVPGADSPSSSSNQHNGQLAGGLDSLSSSMQGLQGLQTAAAAATGRSSLSPVAAAAASNSMLPLPGRLPGGMTAAAGQLLASSAASYYNGTGPLTGGAKQSWSTGKYGQSMEAGKCLAEVRLL
jgi:hypothetical protein